MTNGGDFLFRYMALQKAVLSSLRLKDVLDAVVVEFANLAEGAKVAVFLADNDALALKLMAARGYSAQTLDLVKVVPFSAEGILKYVVQNRQPVSTNDPGKNDISGTVLKREGSAIQLGIPLISANLLVGAILLDSQNPQLVDGLEFLNAACEPVAMAIANSILYGRSEYERERLNTLYKTSIALGSSALRTSEVLQVAADTSLVLANTTNCAVLVYDPENDRFNLGAFKGLDGQSLNEFDLSARDTIAGTTLRSGRTEYFGDRAREPFGLPTATGGSPFHSVLALPLQYNGHPLGVIEVFSTERNAFHKEQAELLESLSAQVANALYASLTHESTKSQTIHDAHTGLYTRQHFEECIAKEVERSKRHNHEIGLLLLDIDHLAQINEALGEERGDEAIRHVAYVIKQTLRDIDLVCRYGGEQFAVLLPETPHQAVLEVAERLRQTIRANNAAGVGMLTVSVGIASMPFNSSEPYELLGAAQEALDVAKFQGRDRAIESQLGSSPAIGSIAWTELAKQAKLSVISERQGKLQNRLDVAPEYASWMTKNPTIVKRRT
jgi:diguanylate cyclase (GGDEF)-like protein